MEQNQIPERTVEIMHPGICDPLDSPVCKGRNYFLECEEKFETCKVLNEDGLKNITVRMPKTRLPTERTTYIRTYVELPQDGDYHLVAMTPYLDNSGFVHHTELYGCDEFNGPIDIPLNTPIIQTTFPRCSNVIGAWSAGFRGTCYDQEFGVRFGAKKGYKTALLEIHFNNPERMPNITDSSGVVLYYTTKLRKYDGGCLHIGQMNINIPPRKERVAVSGTCQSSCTKSKMTGPIYIAAIFHHMHQNGIAAKTELFRNGTKIVDVYNEEQYFYDMHKMHILKEPVQMLPGDELKMTCLYTSKYKTTSMHYGLGTSREMCFGFLQFYPIDNSPLSRCISSPNGLRCEY